MEYSTEEDLNVTCMMDGLGAVNASILDVVSIAAAAAAVSSITVYRGRIMAVSLMDVDCKGQS